MNDDSCKLVRQSRVRLPAPMSLGCSWLASVSVWQSWMLTLCVGCLSASCLQAQDSPDHILSSNILVEPIDLPMVVPEAKVSRIKVIADFEDSPATAEIELDLAQVAFNDFGDAIRMGPPDVKRLRVHLEDISNKLKPSTNKEYHIYEVQEFQEPKRGMRLAVPVNFKLTDNHGHVRLVLYKDHFAADVLILRWHDDEKGANSFEAQIQRKRWSTDALKINGSLKEITIDQWDDKTASLHLDPNDQSRSAADGIILASTLLGWGPRQVNVVDTQTADPLKLGRKLWELNVGEPRRTRYFVTEDEQGKHHRLVIKIDDKIRYVSPLTPE